MQNKDMLNLFVNKDESVTFTGLFRDKATVNGSSFFKNGVANLTIDIKNIGRIFVITTIGGKAVNIAGYLLKDGAIFNAASLEKESKNAEKDMESRYKSDW